MELVVALIFISLPHRLTVVLCSGNENAFGAKAVRSPGSEGNADYLAPEWYGFVAWSYGPRRVEGQLRAVLETLSILVCFVDHFAIEGLALTPAMAINPMPFQRITFLQTTKGDDKYICNYSRTPVWLVHLLLGCFHGKFFIVMTFQFGILKFHLCPFSSVIFQWLRYLTSELC